MTRLWIILACGLLAGCATSAATAPVAIDTFCFSAKKRTWDPDTDSVETMREAVVWNKTVDRRCGMSGKKA